MPRSKIRKIISRGVDSSQQYPPYALLPESPIPPPSDSELRSLSLLISSMATGELLGVEPMELQFPFELHKQISCSMYLSNKTDSHLAFKVKTTNPKKYCVRPNTGFVSPRSSCEVVVTMQAQKDAPLELQCKDKFLVQSAVASSGSSPKDITPEMFSKESGNLVEEYKLRVSYVSPPRSPAPVEQGLEDLSSGAGANVLDNGSVNNSEFTVAPRADNDHEDNFAKEKALVERLKQERDSFIQQNNKLRQELELLRRESTGRQGGIPLMYVMVVGLIALLLGYLIKKT